MFSRWGHSWEKYGEPSRSRWLDKCIYQMNVTGLQSLYLDLTSYLRGFISSFNIGLGVDFVFRLLCLILSVFCGCALPPYLVWYLTLRFLTWFWLTLPPLGCKTAGFFLFCCKLMFYVCLPAVGVSFYKDVLQNIWCQLLFLWFEHSIIK